MTQLKITGNANPVVGEVEIYSIDDVFHKSMLQQNDASQNYTPNAFDNEIKWSIWILERGSWRKTKENDKTGKTVTYTFHQKSLLRKGIKLICKVNDKKAILDITPQRASQGKIIKVDLLDANYSKPTRPFAYNDWIVARVHCVDMERFPLQVTLWEDDGGKTLQNTTNVKIETKKANVINGKADVKFYLDPSHAWLANAKLALGDTSEGANHEYYVTAEIFEKVSNRVYSFNTDVPNPDYKPPTQKQPTPAEQKGPSKKETKGINTNDAKVHDYHEQKVFVNNTISTNPVAKKINSVMTVDVDNKWWEKKEEKTIQAGCYCTIGLTEEIIQKLAPDAIPENVTKYGDGFNKTFEKFGINTCLKKIHFFAQVIHESGSFKFNVEQGNKTYLAKYGGWHGRGLIQLTLKKNYEDFEKFIGEDFTSSDSSRDKVCQSPFAVYSAGWFWKNKNLNELSQTNDFIYITFKVNGGFNHIDDRLKHTKKGFEVLYKNCKNDTGKTTDYKFSNSKGYQNKKCSFAWALWHDPLFTKDGCTKNKEKAIEGYQRYIDLTDENDTETNFYGIAGYKHFKELIFISNKGKKKVKVREAAIKRIEELK